jgi:membrane-associated phospholipid phosphatase
MGSALWAWFISQSLIGSRATTPGEIGDGVHDVTAPLHRYLQSSPRLVNGILITSSLFIDLFGVFLIGISILGPTLRPFVAMLIVFLLRQACQTLCALPAPPGMIWRSPGVPSLLVTYEVANDFFFSGHTAIAILGAVEVAHILPWWAGVLAGIVAFAEASMVLVLRAHYTMDVIAAAFAAYFALCAAGWLMP